MNDQLIQYNDFADRYEAAYAAHRRTYIVRVPPPERIKVRRENTWVLLALSIMVLASVIVSGSRTITEFGGGVVGISSFIMLEFGVVVYAFIRTRENYDEKRHADVKRLINTGMWLSFSAAASANLHATLKQNGVEMPPIVDLAIFVVLALSAPTLAFIAGDVAGMYAVKDAQRQRKADDLHREQMDVWAEGLKASWDREKVKYGVRPEVSVGKTDIQTLPAPSAAVLSVQTQTQTDERQTSRAGFGHNRTSDGQQKVLEYLVAHPDEVALPLRTLAESIGVNKDTVNAGRKLWQAQQFEGATDDEDTAKAPAVGSGS